MRGKCFTWFVVFSYVSSIALPLNTQIFRQAQAAEPIPPQAQPAPRGGTAGPTSRRSGAPSAGTGATRRRSQPTRAHTATASFSPFRGNGFAQFQSRRFS